MSHKIIQGDNVATLKTFKDNSIDSIITDPPYGIEFLGKDWDSNTGAVETWQECLRVLKPGGYLLAFSAARTYHHLATNIESVGFEIRDQLMWLYASGFPKAQDIGKAIQRRQGVTEYEYRDKTDGYNLKNEKGFTENNDVGYGKMKGIAVPTSPEAQQWSGWKTALKPAHEPIVMARKPFKGSTIDNVLAHGVGALNIDATRIPFQNDKDQKSANGFDTKYDALDRSGGPTFQKDKPQGGANGWSRIEFGEKEPVKYRDQKPRSQIYTNTVSKIGGGHKNIDTTENYQPNEKGRFPSNVVGEVEGYQKYFYCPKVSRRERHCGFEQTNIPAPFGDVKGAYQDGERFAAKHQKLQDPLAHIKTGGNFGDALKGDGEMWGKHQKSQDPLAHIEKPFQTNNRLETLPGKTFGNDGAKLPTVGNNHPTVKPVALMRWLINLVTPPNSKVLDPFCGSGSTGMAAVELGHEFVGCELDPNYVAIANCRIEGWNRPKPNNSTFEDIFDASE